MSETSLPRAILTDTNFLRELDALITQHTPGGKKCGMILILADEQEQAMMSNIKEKETVTVLLINSVQESKNKPEGDARIDLRKKPN